MITRNLDVVAGGELTTKPHYPICIIGIKEIGRKSEILTTASRRNKRNTRSVKVIFFNPFRKSNFSFKRNEIYA